MLILTRFDHLENSPDVLFGYRPRQISSITCDPNLDSFALSYDEKVTIPSGSYWLFPALVKLVGGQA
jgi:hypothetical protein